MSRKVNYLHIKKKYLTKLLILKTKQTLDLFMGKYAKVILLAFP